MFIFRTASFFPCNKHSMVDLVVKPLLLASNSAATLKLLGVHGAMQSKSKVKVSPWALLTKNVMYTHTHPRRKFVTRWTKRTRPSPIRECCEKKLSKYRQDHVPPHLEWPTMPESFNFSSFRDLQRVSKSFRELQRASESFREPQQTTLKS